MKYQISFIQAERIALRKMIEDRLEHDRLAKQVPEAITHKNPRVLIEKPMTLESAQTAPSSQEEISETPTKYHRKNVPSIDKYRNNYTDLNAKKKESTFTVYGPTIGQIDKKWTPD